MALWNKECDDAERAVKGNPNQYKKLDTIMQRLNDYSFLSEVD